MRHFQYESVLLSSLGQAITRLSASRFLFCVVALAALIMIPLTARSAEAADEIERLKRECKDLILNQSKLAEARPVAERMLALALEQRGEEHLDTIAALHLIGYIAQQSGDYEKAEKTWLKSLGIQERQPTCDPLWHARTLHMLASLYQNQLDFARAEEFLKRALEVRVKHLGPDHTATANVLRTLGRFHWALGDYATAESYLSRALEVFERSGRYEEHEVAETVSTMGQLHQALGDLDKAESFIQRGLRIQERLLGSEHIATANSLQSLAIVRMRRNDLAGAELLLRRSLAICEKLDGRGYFRSVDRLRYLGLLYQKFGKLDEAEALQQRALVILQENLGPTHPRTAPVLNTLGRLYEAGGEYQRAQEVCDQAYLLLKGGARRSQLGVMRDLARLQCAQGHPESAVVWANQIQGEEERRLSNLLSFTSERQRLTNQREVTEESSINLWATIGATEPLARSIIRTKGIVLDSLLEDRRLAEAAEDAHTRELASQLTAAKRRLTQVANADLFEASSVDETRPREVDLESLSRDVESLEASLARSVTGLGRARRALSIRVEQVQSAIPRGAVLLELLRYRHYVGKGCSEDNYGVLVLSASSKPKWVALGHAEVVDRLIKLYQHQMRAQGDGDTLTRSLRNLYEQLWTPIEQSLPKGTRQLIVCPDSELNFVSFATLLAPSKRFLGEDYSISYVSSGRDLLTGYPRRRDGIDLLVLANPDFGASVVNGTASTESVRTNDSLAMREFRDLNFRPLPGSEREGRLLRDRATEFGFKSVVLHLGKTATEAELKRVESPHILHLATHGFVLPEISPRAMPDSFEPGDTYPGTIPGFRNPMIRCGLALAGAQRTLEARAKGESVPSENDGVVTAEEIGCLNLRGTRLVVLSACDTGIGEARAGEGVLGLRRGFVQAGAESLLLTLWPIHDEKTTGLITDFYNAFSKHGDATRALSQTQRSWLARLRTEKGIADACRIAGPFILSFQGSPDSK